MFEYMYLCGEKKTEHVLKASKNIWICRLYNHDAGVTDIVREVVREETGQMDAPHLINH